MADNIRIALNILRLLPLLISFGISRNKQLILEDLKARQKYRHYIDMQYPLRSLCLALLFEKEFRNQFYFRLDKPARISKLLLPQLDTVVFESCKNIGEGLVLLHGFQTIINGGSIIGKNCTILHGVTIGSAHEKSPVIGNDVYIGTGAIIVGNIRIGNNVKVGAGTVVTMDIPDNCTVVGQKCRIIQQYA